MSAALESPLSTAEQLLLMLEECLAVENDTRHDRWRKAMLPLIARIAPRADATFEADRLIGIVNGLGLQAAINPTRANRDRALKVLTQHVAELAER